MKKKKKVIAATLALAFVGLATWAYAHFRTDPEVAQVQRLGSELSKAEGDQRKEKWDQFRKALDKLPEDKRKRATEGMRQGFEERQTAEMKKFIAMSPADQKAVILKEIKDQEARRKARAAGAAKDKAKAVASGTGANGANPSGAANANAAQKNASAAASQNGQNGGGNRRTMSVEDRNQSRKMRLDNSTPEQRALRTEYRRQMNLARQSLGLPPRTGRGG